MNDPIAYASTDDTRREARPGRTTGTWVKLVLVWGTGLLVWTVYIAVILYGFFRVMT